MISLELVKRYLIDYFNSHRQVKDVFFVNEFDFNAKSQIDYTGYCVNIKKENPSLDGNNFSHNFQITIADRIDENHQEIEDRIHSDTEQIGCDFLFWLHESEWNYFNLRSVSVPFTLFDDNTGDRVAGIIFHISIPVAYTGSCGAPINYN